MNLAISKKELAGIIVLIAISSFLHLFRLGAPAQPIFDEVHFATYASYYASRQVFWDMPPPLGKLIYGGVAKITGVKEPQSFIHFERDDQNRPIIHTANDEPWNNFPYISLRATSAVAGILLIPLVFLFARLLGLGSLPSFLGTLFITFDNGILLQTRLILLDGFLLFFGMLGFVLLLLKHVRFFEKQKLLMTVLSALALGSAGAVKLTGFGFALAVFIASMAKNEKVNIAPLKKWHFIGLLLIPLFLSFAIQQILIPFEEELTYLAVILGTENRGIEFFESIKTLPFGNVLAIFAAYTANVFLTLTAGLSRMSHAAQSTVLGWPLSIKPIPYWIGSSETISFIGNAALWFLGFLALVWTVFGKMLRKIVLPPAIHSLLIAWLANVIPYLLITLIGRPTYLYHYLPAVIFSSLLLAAIPQNKNFAIVIIGIVLISFILILPLTYGMKFLNFGN